MTVFGIVNDIPFIIGHCVMLGLLLILIVLEYAVEYLDVKAEQYNITLLLVKLKKELMFMGIISFVVFVYSLIAEPSSGDSIYSSFEMSHMIFFFMAIAFLFQALFLTSYSTTIGRTFIMALRTNVKDLLHQYDGMNVRESWWFHHGTALLPFLAPSFRTTIEFRIVERLFIHQHKLSPEFQFAHYVNRLFGVYIAELDHTESIGWSDGCPHILSSDVSSAGFVSTIHTIHRMLESSLGTKAHINDVTDSCKTYIIIYTYVCASLLFLYALFIYGITIMYMERILTLSLTTDGIAAKGNENMRASYKESLTLMDHRERLLKLGAEMRTLGKVRSEKMIIKEPTKPDKSTSKATKSVRVQKRGLSAQLNPDEIETTVNKTKSTPTRNGSVGRSSPDFRPTKIATTDNDSHEDDRGEAKGSDGPNGILMTALGRAAAASTSRDDVQSFDQEVFDKSGASTSRNSHAKFNADVGGGSPSPAPYFDGGDNKHDDIGPSPAAALNRQSSVIIESIMQQDDADDKDNNLNSIFLFGSPAAYFKAVEAILLVQCFYISIAATQMIPMIDNGGWILALIIPVPCILYILQMVLTKAVLLRAVYELNREVASLVIEDAIEESTAKKKLQAAVVEVMDKKAIDPEIRREFLATFFFRYDKKKEGIVRKNDFFRILQNDLHIMISSETFKILWVAIDEDLSGGLDLEEVLHLFDMKKDEDQSPTEPVAVVSLRESLRNLLLKKQLPIIEWEAYIHNVFKRYDGDNSGEIDRSEFFLMLQSLDIHVPKEQEDELLLAVDSEGSGSISFDEFFDVFFVS